MQTKKLDPLPCNLRLCFHPAQRAFENGWGPAADDAVPEPQTARMLDHAGKFWTNNGVIAVYDEVGDPLVTCVQELEDRGINPQDVPRMLQSAGYRCESCWVPHSNDGGAFVLRMRELHQDQIPASV